MIVVAAAMFAAVTASAQMGVKCQINDNEGEGVPYATVIVYRAADTTRVVSSGVSDAFGVLNHQVNAAGSYKMKTSFVGMKPLWSDFSVSAEHPVADLGTLVLSPQGNVLKTIEVKAQRQLIKAQIDRLSYDVQADAESKTSNLLDMLKKVPMVAVDGQDEIRVQGSTSYKIYMNGHPAPAFGNNAKDIMKAVPASMIKRIEVITDPGAKYDAEGTSAILNIVTADNSQVNGVTGTIGVGIDNFGSPNANANLTTQIGKVVTNINYGYSRQTRHRAHTITEAETNYGDSGMTLYETNESRASVDVHYGDISASWEPDTANLLSASAGGYYYRYVGDGESFTRMNDATGQTLYSFNGIGHTPGTSYYSLHGRADYQHKTRRPDEMLTLSYMISANRSKNSIEAFYSDMLNAPMPYSGYQTNSTARFTEHTLQFDWTRPFARYHKLETGAKYINRLNKSDNTNTYDGCPELDMTTLFDHTTQVAAAYVNYTYSRDKWTGRAGLRYEFSHLSGKYPDGSAENFHRNLNDWVPDLSVEYKPSWANSYKLSFSTSIERPGITYLNPAIQSTPTTLSFGNPMLASAHIYKLAFTYLHLGAKLTYSIAPDLSFSNNQIIGVQYLEDGKMTSTFENTLKSRRIGVNGFAQWQIGATTSWMLNANVGHNRNRSDVLELTNEHWSSFMYTQLTQKLPWKLTMTAGVGENSGMIDGLYGHRNGMWFYTMSLQRSFLKEDRLTVSLRASNFFNHKFNSMTTYITRGDYTGTSSMKFIMRGAMLNVSYRFGSLKAKVKKTNATINNDDVVGGSKAGNDQTQQSGMGGTSM